jgi:hypothetical protein
VSRRLILLYLLVASQLSTGCWCVRQRIAWRWHNHQPVGCGPVCAPACATPAFRIPSPVMGMPVGAPGCSTCTTGLDHGPAGYAVPVGHAGSIGAPPIIGTPMPLGAPRIETPTPMPPGSGGAKQ